MADFLYDKEVTPWEDPGVAPEEGQRIWQAGEEPPAAWWNWFWDATQKCFVNIKTWINAHKDANTGVHGVGTGHIETEEGAQTKVNNGISAHLAASDPHPVYATDNDLSSHNQAGTGVHGVGTGHIETSEGAQAKVDSGFSAHLAAADPHTQYVLESEITSKIPNDAIDDNKIGNRTATPTQVPSGSTGKLTQWLSWFCNRLVALTGRTNWYDTPRTTLENAVRLNGDTMTGGLTTTGLTVSQNSDAIVTLEDTGALNTTFRKKSIFSSRNVNSGNDWLFRMTRPSDNAIVDFVLSGTTGGSIWHQGNFNPATKSDTTHNHDSTYLKLSGGTISKAIGTTGSYSNSHLMLQASDVNDVALGFHRPGQTACTLLHKANYAGLQLVDASGAYTEFRAGKVFNAVYNDYAEYFLKDEELEPGDVIAQNPNGKGYIKAKTAYEKLVVGVYSDDYAQCIGGDSDKNVAEQEQKYAPVGLAGRVKVKVAGEVAPGDLLVASGFPGVAMAAKEYIPGTVIGKALGSHSGQQVDRIEMLVLNM